MGACRSRAAEAAEPVSIDPGPPPPAKRPVVPRNVTVVVIGLDNAGKTTIVNNLIGGLQRLRFQLSRRLAS
jgi:GTP-binding protein EngB required for normal cell division